MKNTILILSLLISNALFSQTATHPQTNYQEPVKPIALLKRVLINPKITTHVILPDPVTYVDISSKEIVGDLPAENIVRIKPNEDLTDRTSVITIVGQKYMVQLQLVLSTAEHAYPEVRLSNADVKPIYDAANSLSKGELSLVANKVNSSKKNKRISSKHDGMLFSVDNIVTLGDFFFIKVTLKNKTEIKYDIDDIRFVIADHKVLKATNSQEIELEPVYILNDQSSFANEWSNIFVFRKFTIPEIKRFRITVSERQISGRTISVAMKYKDILQADTF